ncbi:LuxR C-terminal-related transcriptional regulator [Pseudomonas turukhanskensis]|uniref:Helix-turn-helix transcriptional regulator n=1 Tax=Pseudomonas turukhanskensis TaxID=1806536 RepID=A0A9W6KB62_9PSED|nr:LuxR C-terminal-related transcriptional regulator [Pseudomonas turukhanskensis]GLK90323.1 helix-turn-helix transcriptional regulator [Pseudomonas turukhanskensis]
MALRHSERLHRLRAMNNADDSLVSLPLGSLRQWHSELQLALTHVEGLQALSHLAGALGHLVPVQSLMISLERKDQPPQLLYQQGIPEHYRDWMLNRYFSGGYLLDPFCLAVEGGLAEGFYHLSEIAPDDFFSSQYYKNYYLEIGCAEDSYYIVNLDSRSKLSVCLFQGMGAQNLAPEQLNLLRAMQPMVREVLAQFGRHWLQQSGAGDAATEQDHAVLSQRIQVAFNNFGCDLLTEREREVAHMVLRGHSVKSAAYELAISPETVRMHRKNLYLKLGINSQAELFAQFIDWLRQG